MAKYKVEVGGFVTVFRQRNLIISAENEDEAKEKAIDKFVELQVENGVNMCNEGTVDSIERL